MLIDKLLDYLSRLVSVTRLVFRVFLSNILLEIVLAHVTWIALEVSYEAIDMTDFAFDCVWSQVASPL